MSRFGRHREDLLPLHRHELLRSADVDQMAEESTRLFCPHRLEPAGAGRVLDARLHSARLRRTSVNYMQYGAEVTVTPGELQSFYLVHIPLTGSGVFTSGTDQVRIQAGLAFVPDPRRHLSLELTAKSTYLVIRIERRALEAELHDLLDAPLDRPIRFDAAMDMTRGPGLSWWSYVRHLVEDLASEDNLVEHAMTTSVIEHVVTTGLLTAQRHNYTDALTGRTRAPGPQQIQRAVELIEDRPDAVSSIAELAHQVGVSARALQAGFRRHLDSTPGEYLRSARLKRAHADLQDGTMSVSEVATRWGYSNIGRFAAEYRNRYGERPSETLRHVQGRS